MTPCSKHKSYTGKQYPKRECKKCLAIYAHISCKTDSEYGKYFSLTTPHYRCNIFHLLAEISTIMLLGKQPPLFWARTTSCDPKAKKHFLKTKDQLWQWNSRDKERFKQFEEVMYNIFTKHFRTKEYLASLEPAIKVKVKKEEKKEIISTDIFSGGNAATKLWKEILDGEKEK